MVLLYVSIMVVISMAIIIPSRNIYKKSIEKVKANFINSVGIDKYTVKSANEFDVIVHREDGITEFYTTNESEVKKLVGKASDKAIEVAGSAHIPYTIAYLSFGKTYNYSSPINVEIPRLIKNKYIPNIYRGDIKYSIEGKVTKYDIYCSYTGQISLDENIKDLAIGEIKDTPIVSESTTIYTPPTTLKMTTGVGEQGYNPNIEFEIEITPKTNSLSSVTITYDNDLIKVNGIKDIFLGCETIEMKHLDIALIDFSGSTYTNGTMRGIRTVYEPTSLKLQINGDLIGIDLVEGNVSFIENSSGDIVEGTSDKPFSIDRNELLQENTYLGELAKNIIDNYSNGKETATLLCSISDYYDESKNKVIAIDSTNKMCFRMYDEVIPYTFGADGEDKPLSKNKDGSPKHFKVLGVKPIYDGAVWQELTLQEV